MESIRPVLFVFVAHMMVQTKCEVGSPQCHGGPQEVRPFWWIINHNQSSIRSNNLEPKWPIFWKIWPIKWKVNPQKTGQLGSRKVLLRPYFLEGGGIREVGPLDFPWLCPMKTNSECHLKIEDVGSWVRWFVSFLGRFLVFLIGNMTLLGMIPFPIRMVGGWNFFLGWYSLVN